MMGLMSASLAIIICWAEVCSTVVVGTVLGILMGVVGEAAMARCNRGAGRRPTAVPLVQTRWCVAPVPDLRASVGMR
jgi:hypothetical protein